MKDLLNDVKMFSQVKAAGFSLTGVKAIDTHDGYCWTAALCSGKTKIVTVSNGGYGGPDQLDFHGANREAADKALQQLYSLPLVKAFFQSHLVEMERFNVKFGKCTEEQFKVIEAQILANEVTVTEEMLGILVDELRAIKEQVAGIKRKLKGKIGWLSKGQTDQTSFSVIAIEDNQENREKLLQRYPDIAVFLNDVVSAV